MSPKPYPGYKDSGLNWLGDVPTHWELNKVGRVSKSTVGWTPPTGTSAYFEGENKWANISDLGARTINNTSKRISDEAVKVSRLQVSPPGSLLFSFKLSVGHVSFAGAEMYTNEAIATFFETDKVALEYAYYAYPIFIVENAGENIYGARILNQERISNARIALPPISEQRAISAYLDRETADVDAFIADQEQLIALLAERRRATITHAVTKGLDPDVQMKDGGVPWLGSVPRHWTVRGIKSAAIMTSGAGFPHEYQGLDDQEIPFHKVNALAAADADGVIRGTRDTVSRETARKLGAKIQPPGTIVMAKIGAALLLGRMRFTNQPSCIDNNMLGIVAKGGVDPEFLIYALQIVVFDLIVNPGAVPSLDMTAFRDYPLAFPHQEEQQLIVNFLVQETSEIDSVIADAQGAIALSKERRAALISAAVTGKIDVRGMGAPANTGEAVSVGVA